MALEHYQTTATARIARLLLLRIRTIRPVSSSHTGFAPLLFGVAIAIVLSLFLKETGRAARVSSSGAVQEVQV